jgi:hypothetical protein
MKVKSIFCIFLVCLCFVAKVSAQSIVGVRIQEDCEVGYLGLKPSFQYGADNILFPKAMVRQNHIRRVVKSWYAFNKKDRLLKKRTGKEIYEFTPAGDLSRYKGRYNLNSFRVIFSPDSSLTTLIEGEDIMRERKTMTDSGLLITDSQKVRHDPQIMFWTFLVKQLPGEEKVLQYHKDLMIPGKPYSRARLGYNPPVGGYFKIKTDSGYLYRLFGHDTAVYAIANCYGRFNRDSTIYCQRCLQKKELRYNTGFIIPPDVISYYKDRRLVKQLIDSTYQVTYDDKGRPASLYDKVCKTDTSFCNPRFIVRYAGNSSLPVSKIYFDDDYYECNINFPGEFCSYKYEFYE